MAAKKTKSSESLQKLSLKKVTIFKIANRKGYAAIAKRNLTEGRTAYQAYTRLRKACKRNGFRLPDVKASKLKIEK